MVVISRPADLCGRKENNRSLLDIGKDAIVSQFTLYGDCRKDGGPATQTPPSAVANHCRV
jgi:D-Tyr-tRNAtyr deacylase